MAKIACLIPDRGDRPKFLQNCYNMLNGQTLKPELIATVDYKPLSNMCDITQRYRIGYDQFKGSDFDLIFFIENDDYYRSDYLETMVKEWERADKPDVFGIGVSLYYHILNRSYFTMEHHARACAMNTAIKPNLDVKFGADFDPYFDLFLWLGNENKHLSKHTFVPNERISIGIKHGTGLSGGHHHSTRMERYKHKDNDLRFLRDTIKEKEPFLFYSSFSEFQ